jgi:anti-sigma regulatory factor (Ser/Thr protein kinase)
MMGYVFMRFGADFRPENVDRLREKVGECLNRAGIHGSTNFLLLNMMDELICNILEHAKASWVELEVHPREKEVTVIFRDDGPAFNPSPKLTDEAQDKHIDQQVEHAEGRRMGLYIVSQIAKEWQYQRLKNQANELSLRVDLEAQEVKR